MTAVSRVLNSPSPSDLPHRLVLHPFALASAYVLSVFVEVQISPHAMFRSLVIALVAAGILTGLFWALTRNRHKAGVMAAVALFVVLTWHAPLLAATALILLVLVLVLVARIAKAGIPWSKATFALNVLGMVLLGAVAIKAIATGTPSQVAVDLVQGTPTLGTAASQRVEGPPDIYLILLDAYPREDTLQRVFGHDNQPFLTALETRGFDVLPGSRSNYAATKLTMASMLNMKLLHEIEELNPILEGQAEEMSTLRNITGGASALGFVRDQGYEVVANAPGYEETALRRADVFIDGGQLNEFEMILLRPTALAEIIKVAAPDFVASQQRGRVADGLRLIRDVARPAERPRFALIHLPTPHAPLLYGRHGEPRRVDLQRPHDYDADGQTPQEQVEQYREQLDYVNQEILSAVDEMLAQPGIEPVVVIWSDHGSLIDLDTDPDLRLSERVSNLFATRTPGQDDLFADNHTLVNTLPILFNAYLSSSFPMAADRSFVSQQPFLFDWVEIAPDLAEAR